MPVTEADKDLLTSKTLDLLQRTLGCLVGIGVKRMPQAQAEEVAEQIALGHGVRFEISLPDLHVVCWMKQRDGSEKELFRLEGIRAIDDEHAWKN